MLCNFCVVLSCYWNIIRGSNTRGLVILCEKATPQDTPQRSHLLSKLLLLFNVECKKLIEQKDKMNFDSDGAG